MILTPHRRTLLLLTLFALALRVTLVLLHPFIFPDSLDYHTLGIAIFHGHAYVVNGLLATRMPGYPLFVALIYMLAGPSQTAVLLVQAVLSAAIVPLTYALARRFDPRAALPAALLITIDPLTLAFSAALLSESLFTLILLAMLLVSLRILDNSRLRLWLLLALLSSIAIYLRAATLYLIPLLAIFLAFASPGTKKSRLLSALALLFLVALTLLPWQIRNIARFNSSPLTLTSLEGISLYESVYPDADGGPRQHLLQAPPEIQSLNEMQQSQAWSKLAWQHIRDEPLRITRLAFIKIARTWSPFFNTSDFNRPLIQIGSALWHIPLFALALLGIIRARKIAPLKSLAILLLPVLYFTLLHALFLGSVRYRVPLMPILCIFAAVALASLFSRYAKRGDICAKN